MPKLTCAVVNQRDGQEAYVDISPVGFIDSSSSPQFERALDRAASAGTRFAILDLSRVHFINSTGISLIIRSYGVFKERDGLLLLLKVPKTVGLSLHLLGVTSLIPFHNERSEALAQFREVVSGSFSYPDSVNAMAEDLKGAAAGKKKVFVPARRDATPFQSSRVVLLVPKPGRFQRIFKLRFRELNGNFLVFHDARRALVSIQEQRPDLVVVDARMDPDGEFVTRLKLHPERSLISLVKIYGKATDVARDVDFKIWENDYLVDPFEILELFSLSEAELLRVPKDRKVFSQQVRFEFRTTKENLEKTTKLCDAIVRASLHKEEDRTALLAAVKEGIDNAVLHGNRWSEERKIDINFLVDRKKITVIIEDQGNGFDFEYYLSRIDDDDTFEHAKKQILDEGQRGGLGILLMHRCADRIAYSGSGNILRMEKNRA